MRPMHTRLMLPSAVVGILVVFGGGFIVGMWYQTHQQLVPSHAIRLPDTGITALDDTGEPRQDALTFYETLTASDMAYAPLASDQEATSEAPDTSPSASPLTLETNTAPPVPTEPKVAEDTRRSAARAPVIPPPGKATTHPRAASQGTSVRTEAAARSRKALPSQEERRVRRPVRDMPPTSTAPDAGARGSLSVQVGSFGTPERAEQLRQRLQQQGYPARVQSSVVPGQGVRYRVRVGNYATPESARQTAGHLKIHEQVPAVIAR